MDVLKSSTYSSRLSDILVYKVQNFCKCSLILAFCFEFFFKILSDTTYAVSSFRIIICSNLSLTLFKVIDTNENSDYQIIF